MTNYIDEDITGLNEPPDWPEPDYGDANIPDEALDFGEPPDSFPESFVPAEPPDLDDPTDDYAPPAYLVGVPDSILDIGFDGFGHDQTADLAALTVSNADGQAVQMTLDDVAHEREAAEADRGMPDTLPLFADFEAMPDLGEQALDSIQPDDTERLSALEEQMLAAGYDLEQLDRDNPYFHVEALESEQWKYDPVLDSTLFAPEPDPQAFAAPNGETTWDRYYEAVVSGQNIGGSEDALIARANEMNLVDARFLGYSDEEGHHVSALELAVDPATGQGYGQALNIASFDDVDQAAALYYELQGHVFDQTLPNYAVADLASHAALEHDSPLDWQIATEQDLVLYDQLQAAELSSDEPPEPLMNQLIHEYTGVDLTMYENEGAFEYDPELEQPTLNYGIEVESEREGKSYLGLVKEWDGGPRNGGGDEYRLIGAYDNRETAENIAQDLWNLQRDVENLTGDPVAGWQSMASMAYEIGVANNAIQQGEPLFAHPGPNTPADPFEIQPTDLLFAQYEVLQRGLDIELDRLDRPSESPNLAHHDIDF